jgi:hypothetical protein
VSVGRHYEIGCVGGNRAGPVFEKCSDPLEPGILDKSLVAGWIRNAAGSGSEQTGQKHYSLSYPSFQNITSYEFSWNRVIGLATITLRKALDP